jgi:small-conductance mechanosensitive channel
MSDLLATLFINPLICARWTGMLLVLPLSLAVSVVYKTIKCRDLREVPLAVLVSWLTILVGMAVVGVALLGIYHLLA